MRQTSNPRLSYIVSDQRRTHELDKSNDSEGKKTLEKSKKENTIKLESFSQTRTRPKRLRLLRLLRL